MACVRRLDLTLLRAFRTGGHTPEAERAVRAFSRLGEHAALWFAVGGTGYLASSGERRAAYARSLRTVAVAYGANTLIKLVVRRRRPRLPGLPPLLDTLTELSYPSAHASTSFAAARSLPLPSAPLVALAAAMAATRPYLGLHYPTDTLAGAALGCAVAELTP